MENNTIHYSPQELLHSGELMYFDHSWTLQSFATYKSKYIFGSTNNQSPKQERQLLFVYGAESIKDYNSTMIFSFDSSPVALACKMMIILVTTTSKTSILKVRKEIVQNRVGRVQRPAHSKSLHPGQNGLLDYLFITIVE